MTQPSEAASKYADSLFVGKPTMSERDYTRYISACEDYDAGRRAGLTESAAFLRRHARQYFVKSEGGNYVEVSFEGHPAKALEELADQGAK